MNGACACRHVGAGPPKPSRATQAAKSGAAGAKPSESGVVRRLTRQLPKLLCAAPEGAGPPNSQPSPGAFLIFQLLLRLWLQNGII